MSIYRECVIVIDHAKIFERKTNVYFEVYIIEIENNINKNSNDKIITWLDW